MSNRSDVLLLAALVGWSGCTQPGAGPTGAEQPSAKQTSAAQTAPATVDDAKTKSAAAPNLTAEHGPLSDPQRSARAAHHVKFLLAVGDRHYQPNDLFMGARRFPGMRRPGDPRVEAWLEKICENPFAVESLLAQIDQPRQDSSFDDPSRRPLALLAHVGNAAQSALPILLERLERAVAQRDERSFALQQLYSRTQGDDAVGSRDFIEFDRSDEPDEQLTLITLCLGKIGPPARQALPTLLSLLDEPDIGRYGGVSSDIADVVYTFREIENIPVDSFEALLIWAVANIAPDSQQVFNAIVPHFQAERDEPQEETIRALVAMQVNRDQVGKILREYIEQKHARAVGLAIRELMRLAIDSPGDALRCEELLKHKNKRIRSMAEYAEVAIAVERQNVPELIAALEIRGTEGDMACKALATMALQTPDQVVPPLVQCIKKPHYYSSPRAMQIPLLVALPTEAISSIAEIARGELPGALQSYAAEEAAYLLTWDTAAAKKHVPALIKRKEWFALLLIDSANEPALEIFKGVIASGNRRHDRIPLTLVDLRQFRG